ncbi:hypothetical protein SAMN05444161_1424 [Rhizobiales bacterium GAS191]|nr:hypothetical protein SAMN05444161_1424 [Rhizobiales bacterium GAS191]
MIRSVAYLVLHFALADGVLKMSKAKFVAGRRVALNDAYRLSEAEEGAIVIRRMARKGTRPHRSFVGSFGSVPDDLVRRLAVA